MPPNHCFSAAKRYRRTASPADLAAFNAAVSRGHRKLWKGKMPPAGDMQLFFDRGTAGRAGHMLFRQRIALKARNAYDSVRHFLQYSHCLKKPFDAWCLFCLPEMQALTAFERVQCVALLTRDGLWDPAFDAQS